MAERAVTFLALIFTAVAAIACCTSKPPAGQSNGEEATDGGPRAVNAPAESLRAEAKCFSRPAQYRDDPPPLDAGAHVSRESAAVYDGVSVTKADPHEGYREVVGVVSASVVCTGIWIGPGAVLTAAHCLCGSRKGALRVMVGAQTSYPELYFEVPEGSDHRITKIAQDGLLKDGDVALLLFDETKPVVACDVARPALPTPPRRASASNLSPVGLALGTEAVVVGFGLTGGDEDTRSEHVKFRAYLDEVDPGCTSLPHDGGSPLCAPKTELFARHRAGTRDTCYGDSGGPIYLRTASGELVLAGVTSRGLEGAGAARCVDGRAATSPAGAGRCGSGGIYTRVDGEVAAWIHRYVPSFRAD